MKHIIHISRLNLRILSMTFYVMMIVLVFPKVSVGTTYYVDDDYGNPYPGSGTPTDPFYEIQMGIDTSTYQDLVQVAAGTYYETITMASGVEIQGAGPSASIIDGGGSGPVVTANSVDINAKLDGFGITNGSATLGGGMFITNCSPTISYCLIAYNEATHGGGMYIRNLSSPQIAHCVIFMNEANAYDSMGGGIYIEDSSPTLDNCYINNNYCYFDGGGVYNSSSDPTFTNCTVSGNSVSNMGGGMYSDLSDPTITGCTFSSNSAGDDGGGMYNYLSSPTVTDCTFSSNIASYNGGGMYTFDSSPTLTDCTFSYNDALSNGGGMYNDESTSTATNCTFSYNSATQKGGGIFNDHNGPTVTNCTFDHNGANNGGGICNYNSTPTLTGCNFSQNEVDEHGGGMYNEASSPVVTDCSFTSNSADGRGGGMYNYDDSGATVADCNFISNTGLLGAGMANEISSPELNNCIFRENTAANEGGGIWNISSTPVITNCTLSGNTATKWYGGGISNVSGSHAVITNCILWANTALWYDEIFNDTSTPVVTYSDITGGYPGTGNIDADPLFVNPGAGDFHLGLMSPCINTGDNAAIIWPDPEDFEGDPRIIDCYDDGTLVVDMGADEATYGKPIVVWVDDDWLGMPLGVDPDGLGPATVFGYDAFDIIQDAIDIVASGGTVNVVAGTYYENITLKNGIEIHGTAADLCVIDAAGSGTVVTAIDVDSTTLLQELTITHGSTSAGGGLNLFNANLTMYSCKISGNTAIVGGGMCNVFSSPTLYDCTFFNNSASSGAAMFNDAASFSTIGSCTIVGNTADEFGGGVVSRDGSSLTVISCLFESNIAVIGGGGLYHEMSPMHIENSAFVNNSADWGGGMYIVESDPEIINSIFWGNTADSGGGGILYNNSVFPIVLHCTFWDNTALAGSGIACSSPEQSLPSTVQIINSIFWDGGDELWQNDGSTLIVDYSDIQGGYSGTGNINEDPLLMEPASGDFHLQAGSPCVDTADNAQIPGYLTTDFDGRDRIIDGDCDTVAIADMGAIEFNGKYMGDFVSDCAINLLDFSALSASWLINDPLVDIAPFNADGIVDITELRIVAENWLTSW